MTPELLHRPHIERREPSKVAVAARHLKIACIPAHCATAFDELDLAAGQLEAALG